MTRQMKDSGIEWIGEIPADWDVKKTLSCLSMPITDGPHTTPELLSEGVPFVSAEAVSSGSGKIDFAHIRGYISEAFYNECCKKYIPQKNDIYMIKSGATTGKVAVVDTDIRFTIWSPLAVFRANPDKIQYKYLYYALQSHPYQKQIEDKWSFGTQQNIGMRVLEQIKLTVPPLSEQKKIADYLDEKCGAIDEIIVKTEQSVEEYKKLKQSVITETVTKGIRPNRKMKDSGIAWIGEIPENWDVKKLKYAFEIKKDIAGKEGYTVLSITQTGIKPKNITSNEGQLANDYSNYQLVNNGDFAMNHMDLLTGWVDISKYDGVTSPDYRVFRLKDMHNCDKYFLYMMQLCYLNKIFYGLGQGVSGFGRWRLPAEMFLNFLIPIPPLSEQKEIADYLDKKCSEIDALIEKKQQFLTELATYKKSLIYEYVTGKKDVA